MNGSIYCNECGTRFPWNLSACPRCRAPADRQGRGFRGPASSRYVAAAVLAMMATLMLVASYFLPLYVWESDDSKLEEYADHVWSDFVGDGESKDWDDIDDSDSTVDLHLLTGELIIASIALTGLAFLLILVSGNAPRRSRALEVIVVVMLVLGSLAAILGAGYYAVSHPQAWEEDQDPTSDAEGPWDGFVGSSDQSEWGPGTGFILLVGGGFLALFSRAAYRSALRKDAEHAPAHYGYDGRGRPHQDRDMHHGPDRYYGRGQAYPGHRDDAFREPRYDDRDRGAPRYRDDRYRGDRRWDDGYDDRGHSDRGYGNGHSDDRWRDDRYDDRGPSDDGPRDDRYSDRGNGDSGTTDDGYRDGMNDDIGRSDDGRGGDPYRDDGYDDRRPRDDGYRGDPYHDRTGDGGQGYERRRDDDFLDDHQDDRRQGGPRPPPPPRRQRPRSSDPRW